MREAVLEYLLNAAWQLPLLATGAWLASRVCAATPRQRCWTWTLFLALALVLPLKLHLLAAGPVAGAGDALDAHLRTSPVIALAEAPPADPAFSLTEDQTRLVFFLWVAVTGLAAARLAFAFAAARRLVRRAQPALLPPDAARALAAFCAGHGMAEPSVRASSAISGPVAVGAVRPAILLPDGLERRAAHELRAAILHEAAHIQRGDYAFNLLIEVATLPLAWHPAIYPIKSGLRVARETACDQVAAAEMRSPELYAECLVTLARAALAPAALPSPALAMFGRGPLERRVQAVLAPAAHGRLRALRSGAAGLAIVAGVVVPAVLLHVTPSFAREVRLAPPAAPAATPLPPAAPARADAPPGSSRSHDRQVIIDRDGGPRRHAWVASDGTRYILYNGDTADLTPAEQRAIEANTKASIAKAQVQIERAQRDVERAAHNLSVELSTAQIARVQAQVAAAQREVAKLEAEKIAESVKHAQAMLSDPKFAAHIAEAQAHAAQALSDGRVQRALDRAQKALDEHHRGVIIYDRGDLNLDPPDPPDPPAPPPPPPPPDGPN